MGVIRRRDEATGNGDEEKRERGERERQQTIELFLDRTEISAVHGLDQLCLVEREDFVMDGEERHLTCVSEFYVTTVDKYSSTAKEPYAPFRSRQLNACP